jgi:hypothetical protein
MKIKRQIIVSDAGEGFQVYADAAGHPFCLCGG